jgi:hypothetical protein
MPTARDALLAVTLSAGLVGSALPASATSITLDASSSPFVTTFTAVPNTVDTLLFFDNTPLVETGSPVISLSLYNGGALLGGPLDTLSPGFLVFGFRSSSSVFVVVPPPPIDFTSINNGTIAGRLLLTVTGGSIGFNTNDLALWDVNSASSLGATGDSLTWTVLHPLGDLRNIVFGGGVPEPSTWAMMLLGFAGLGYAGYRSAARGRRQSGHTRTKAFFALAR